MRSGNYEFLLACPYKGNGLLNSSLNSVSSFSLAVLKSLVSIEDESFLSFDFQIGGNDTVLFLAYSVLILEIIEVLERLEPCILRLDSSFAFIYYRIWFSLMF